MCGLFSVPVQTAERAYGSVAPCQRSLPPQARAFFARDKAWCIAHAADVGPAARSSLRQKAFGSTGAENAAKEGAYGVVSDAPRLRLKWPVNRKWPDYGDQ